MEGEGERWKAREAKARGSEAKKWEVGKSFVRERRERIRCNPNSSLYPSIRLDLTLRPDRRCHSTL
eukprot:831760-Amorphochlora_amoeboformis.AAC.1